MVAAGRVKLGPASVRACGYHPIREPTDRNLESRSEKVFYSPPLEFTGRETKAQRKQGLCFYNSEEDSQPVSFWSYQCVAPRRGWKKRRGLAGRGEVRPRCSSRTPADSAFAIRPFLPDWEPYVLALTASPPVLALSWAERPATSQPRSHFRGWRRVELGVNRTGMLRQTPSPWVFLVRCKLER